MERIRIWIWWNGPTKITLVKDVPLKLHKSEPTEEGYSYEAAEYLFDGETVYWSDYYGGSDCDGPIHHQDDRIWEPSMGVDSRSVDFPNWADKKSWQRDIYAEKMGY
jgi:hypothetical protein